MARLLSQIGVITSSTKMVLYTKNVDAEVRGIIDDKTFGQLAVAVGAVEVSKIEENDQADFLKSLLSNSTNGVIECLKIGIEDDGIVVSEVNDAEYDDILMQRLVYYYRPSIVQSILTKDQCHRHFYR